ncbi:hypothetical protein HCN44_006261 [Aphidius gifuensis]|uniref:Pre-rRNA-processing protein Ipi1 N-terminal domain-containing protein n=1 Tax=Aphidius gifuensis TaxID=684658 RepID=A0A834XW68_APHGI|nr:testis-expressed protein 10 homolog [Aphidius gifuensis]KAF7993201.1 hypothetical protein HCN44_006261 [Aphidius gifuensis]
MGKNQRHQKYLKSEKAKVKLKTKKGLPTGTNITDTTFKVKKIIIREQLKQHEESEILSRRKLNIKDLLSRLKHHNSTVRQEATKEIKEVILNNSSRILSSNLGSLLQGICVLTLDKESNIRREILKVLSLLLGPIPNEQLSPFSDVLISYLKCAMTHIDSAIKEDSLNFLDVLVQNCGSLVAKNSQKILSNFLDMVSKHNKESQVSRQLTLSLGSKHTSIKWRIKVFESLSSILNLLIIEKRCKSFGNSQHEGRKIFVDKNTYFVELYQPHHMNDSKINFKNDNEDVSNDNEVVNFKKYIDVLMHLMMESWLEVRPKENNIHVLASAISIEAVSFLKITTKIIQQIIGCIDVIESDNEDINIWFARTFQTTFGKYFMLKFPYSQVKSLQRSNKRDNDSETNDKCLSENIGICFVYLWMTSRCMIMTDEVKDGFEKILDYINDRLDNWSHVNDNNSLNQFIKLLKELFLNSSKILYKNRIKLSKTLNKIISVSLRVPKKELQIQLFNILGEIVLDHSLTELHSEEKLKEFIKTLPNLLLEKSISENTIFMINRVSLQHGAWIHNELRKKRLEITENAKKIEITGSTDIMQSRLMICNLFYFIDGQIYY